MGRSWYGRWKGDGEWASCIVRFDSREERDAWVAQMPWQREAASTKDRGRMYDPAFDCFKWYRYQALAGLDGQGVYVDANGRK